MVQGIDEIGEVDSEASIVFLRSGFSLGAKNKSLVALLDDFKSTAGSAAVRKRVEASAAMFVG